MFKFEFNRLESYNIHDILYVQTNVRGLLPDLLKDSKQGEEHPKLYVVVRQLSKRNTKQLTKNMKNGRNYILIDSNKPFSPKKILISDIEGRMSTFYVYLLGIRSKLKRLGNWIEKVFQQLLELKLLTLNATLLHAASLDISGEGLIICAPSDVGKTTTSILLTRHLSHDVKVLSEDLVIITSNGMAFSYPIDVNIHSKHLKVCGLSIGFKRTLALKLQGLIGRVCMYRRLREVLGISKPPRISIPINEIFPSLVDKTNPKIVVILKKGSRNVKEISGEKMARMLMITGWMGAPFFKFLGNKVLLEYFYQCDLDPYEFYRRVYKLYLKLCENSRCYEVSGTLQTYYKDILDLIKR